MLFGSIERAFLQAPAAGRSTFVVSDMHMGVGRAASGTWHASEDFRWPSEFAAFLDAVNTEGRSAVDLVLNGDTFELLQSPTAGCEPAASLAGCRSDEALTRLERVLSAHSAEIAALARFARTGSNRVVIVPGDHDAALLVPAISRRLAAVLEAPAGRVSVAASGYWVSVDGKLYAEHGHQIGFNPHRFETWPAPFVKIGGVEHVARSPGEMAVQPAYNRLEDRYPAVDNFALVGAGLKYALAAEGASDTGDAAASLLRYFLTLMSWQQFRMELDGGETEPPKWDLAQTRALGPAFLVSSLPDDDRFKPTAQRALAEGRLSESLAGLTDDELVAVCDYRAASRRARRRGEPFLLQFSPRGPVVTECPRTPDSRRALFDYFWRSRDEILARHLEAVARQLPSKTAPVVMVHGHTHLPDRGQEGAVTLAAGHLTIPKQGFSPVRGALTPVVVNGGAWQRTITPVQYERLESERGLPNGQLLRTLQPDDLPPCYGFVQIPAYREVPEPSVRYWRQSASGDWAVAAACGR